MLRHQCVFSLFLFFCCCCCFFQIFYQFPRAKSKITSTDSRDHNSWMRYFSLDVIFFHSAAICFIFLLIRWLFAIFWWLENTPIRAVNVNESQWMNSMLQRSVHFIDAFNSNWTFNFLCFWSLRNSNGKLDCLAVAVELKSIEIDRKLVDW